MGDVTFFGLFGPARVVVSGIADRFVLYCRLVPWLMKERPNCQMKP
jgi:hypothetical protein